MNRRFSFVFDKKYIFIMRAGENFSFVMLPSVIKSDLEYSDFPHQ